MGIKQDDEIGDELCGETLEGRLTDVKYHLFVLSLKAHAFQIAASVAAFAAALVRQDDRLALIGAGLLIRPLASWIAISDAPQGVQTAVSKLNKPLRILFIAYCIYVLIHALEGH
ncbi:MAG: hypothetical protein ABI353_15000 [Isosphaeraceae bacterium]